MEAIFCLMQIMAANGVSHHIVEDDLAGVEAMLKWLAFVPPTLPGTLPVLNTTDPTHRDIEYTPDKGAARLLLEATVANATLN